MPEARLDDGSVIDVEVHDAESADDARVQLDAQYATWLDGVRSLGEDGLARPCGRAEGAFAARPMAALVLHIGREVLHHGAEIVLLRDLYAHSGAADGSGMSSASSASGVFGPRLPGQKRLSRFAKGCGYGV